MKPVIFWVDGKYPQLSICVQIYAEFFESHIVVILLDNLKKCIPDY